MLFHTKQMCFTGETMPRADRKPILWAFSFSHLDALLDSVIPQYAGVAEIRLFHKGFEEAIETARELMRGGAEVDVFLSAGANAAWLRAHADVPVAVITPSGLDIMRAIATARRIGPRIGLVTFGTTTPELDQLDEVYRLGISQRSYTSIAEAETAVRSLAAQGVDVIVGPSAVTDLTEQVGLPGVFIYTQNSVREAIDRAIEIARIARTEEARRARIDAILRHLDEAVIAVDPQGRIESLNPAMERLLGISSEAALGAPLGQIAPPLSLARVLETGVAELEGIQRLGDRTIVTNRIPLRELGVATGALLTCQDASAIERVDRNLRSRNRPRRFTARYQLADIVGESPPVRLARSLAERYARTDATVLITGASGTGKELFAQGIHGASARRDRPFVAINCAALPETLLESELFGYDEGAFTGSRRGGKPGLFEAAHTGTIFLDEIGDLPVALQSRLLRVLQEREVLRLGSNDPTPVNVRVIAATNRDLEASVRDGDFREDLYYRLNILQLHVPTLAERPEDLEPLASHLLRDALSGQGADQHHARALAVVLPLLERHSWPGNIRELENVLERVAVLYGSAQDASVTTADLRHVLPELFGPRHGAARDRSDLESARQREERAHIARVLRECGGNQSEAARRLGIGRTTLWRKLRDESETPPATGARSPRRVSAR
jgi:propionate catabolism operon transcriptional regulator